MIASTLRHHMDSNSLYLEELLLPLQALQAAFLWLHDWIPLGRLNDIAAMRGREPGNILRRVTLYDVDSKRIHKSLTDREEQYSPRDIRADVPYFERTYRRAYVR